MSTRPFIPPKNEDELIQQNILEVYDALEEKKYNPINQIVGYLISGDPTFITSHNDARNKFRQFERDEIVSSLLRYFILNRK